MLGRDGSVGRAEAPQSHLATATDDGSIHSILSSSQLFLGGQEEHLQVPALVHHLVLGPAFSMHSDECIKPLGLVTYPYRTTR